MAKCEKLCSGKREREMRGKSEGEMRRKREGKGEKGERRGYAYSKPPPELAMKVLRKSTLAWSPVNILTSVMFCAHFSTHAASY
jgi:hypothetical protein